MAEGKEIRFKWVVDEQSARQVNRVLDEMIKRAQELAKTLAGVNLGGGNGGGLLGGGTVGGRSPSPQTTLARGAPSQRVSFASVLGSSADGFKRMANESTAAMKILGDAVSTSISKQERDIGRLETRLERLAKLYDRVSDAGAKQRVGERYMEVQGALGGARTERQRLSDMRNSIQPASNLLPDIPYPGQEYPGLRTDPSRMDRFKNWFGSKIYSGSPVTGEGAKPLINGFAPNTAGGWLRMGGMALAGADAAFTEARSGTRTFSNAEATRGQMVNARIRALKGGDISDLQAIRMISGASREDLMKQVSGTGAEAEAAVNGAKSMAGRVIGSLSSGLLGQKGGNIMGGFTTAEQQGGMAENFFAQVDNMKKSTQFLRRQMALEQFEGSLGARVSSGRVMGYGLRKDPRSGQYRDTFAERESALQAQGYSVQDEQAAFLGLRGEAGSQAAYRNKGLAMAATGAGYGGFSSLLATSERLGAGRSLAMGALGGGIDRSAGIQLGAGVLGAGFDVRGTTSGAGALAAIQGGMGFSGGPGDFNRVQQALAGLNYGSSITGGSIDPYQQGRNLVGAIGANAGGSTFSQDFLANGMSMKQMLDMAAGGKMTRTASMLGLDQGMIRGQLSESMGSVFDRFKDEGKDDAMSKAIRGFRGSGMGYEAYLKKLAKEGQGDVIETLGASSALLTGGGEEEGIGSARILAGLGSKLKAGTIGGRGPDELVGSRLKAEADRIKEAGVELSSNLKTLVADFGSSGKLAETYRSFGENLSATAEVLAKSFLSLADAATKATVALGGKPAASKAGPRGSGASGSF